jgi:hypothetical protein
MALTDTFACRATNDADLGTRARKAKGAPGFASMSTSSMLEAGSALQLYSHNKRDDMLDRSRRISGTLLDFGCLLACMGFAVAFIGDPLREENPRAATKGNTKKDSHDARNNR